MRTIKFRTLMHKYEAQNLEIIELQKKHIEELETKRNIGKKLNELLRNQRKIERQILKLNEILGGKENG